jgi:hypothetical protein
LVKLLAHFIRLEAHNRQPVEEGYLQPFDINAAMVLLETWHG